MIDMGRVLKSDNAEHALEFERWSRELLDLLDYLESRVLSDAEIAGEPGLLDFEMEVL